MGYSSAMEENVCKRGDVFIQIVSVMVLYGSMALISYYDIKKKKIYNSILIFMILIYFSLFIINSLFFDSNISLKENIISAIVAFLLFFCMKIANPTGIGMGDVKLAFVLGLYLGYGVLEVIGISMLCLCIYTMLGNGTGKKGVPYAPFVLFSMLLQNFFFT
ncbi:MAG: prepilin peptidase [Lachnospiraceae bacterium]|nr:prepilin peptidase [Lachnospiraceae bacterium]